MQVQGIHCSRGALGKECFWIKHSITVRSPSAILIVIYTYQLALNTKLYFCLNFFFFKEVAIVLLLSELMRGGGGR